MGVDLTPTDRPLTGILIPDPLLEVWAEHTTLDQAGVRVGRCVAARPTSLRVVPTGEPVAGDQLELMTSHPGAAGIGVPRFLARPGGGSATWRGRDEPSSLTWWEYIGDSPETTSICGSASVVVCDDGTEVVCYRRFTGADGVYVRVRPPTGLEWSEEITVHLETGPSLNTAPRLILKGESGRLDIYLITSRTSPRSVVRYSSTDRGITWERSALGVLDVSSTVVEISVAEGGGQTMVVLSLDSTGPRRQQWASADDGASWSFVATTDGLHRALTYAGAQFHELVSIAGSPVQVVGCVYGSAFEAVDPELAGVPVFSGGDLPGAPNADGRDRLAIWADDGGNLWALCRTYDDGLTAYVRGLAIVCSADGGQSWTGTGAQYALGAGFTGTATPWRSIAACAGRAGASLFVTRTGSGDQIYLGRLGGWTDRTLPSTTSGAVASNRNPTSLQLAWGAPWAQVYVAAQGEPIAATTGWTVSESGGITVSAGAASCSISGGSGDTASYNGNADTEYATTGAARCAFASLGSGFAYVEATADMDEGGGPFFGLQAIISAAGTITAWDLGAAAAVAATVPTPDEPFEVLVAVSRDPSSWTSSARGYVAYRLLSDGPDERLWTVIVEDVVLEEWTSHGRTRSGGRLQIGSGGASSPSAAILHMAAHASSSGLGWGGETGPDVLHGALWGPVPVYVRDGVSVQAEGLTRRLDSWSMTPEFQYGFTKSLPLVLSDPRRGWRTAEVEEGALAFQYGTVTGAVSRGGLFGFYLDGQSFGSIALDAWTQADAWVEVLPATVPGWATGEVLGAGSGQVLESDTAPELETWYAEGELTGSWLRDGGGGTFNILTNTEGAWRSAEGGADAAQMLISLDDEADGTPGHVIRPRVLILVYLEARVRGWRFRFADPTDGSPGVRVLAMGRVRVLGSGVDETRAVARELGEEIVEGDDGSRTVVRRRADRRRVELSLVRGSPLPEQLPGVHGFVRAQRNGAAVGSVADPLTLDALWEIVGRGPLVYLPAIPVIDGTKKTRALLTTPPRRGGPLYGRFASEPSFRIETAQGFADHDELVRTSVVTLDEEIA